MSAVPDRQGEQYEIGWRFTPSVWGKGYATEAGRALIDLTFNRGARRLYAQTMAVNARSRAVMERLGLRHHTTFHPTFDDPLPGTEHGEVEYEILRSDWMQRRRPTWAAGRTTESTLARRPMSIDADETCRRVSRAP